MIYNIKQILYYISHKFCIVFYRDNNLLSILVYKYAMFSRCKKVSNKRRNS